MPTETDLKLADNLNEFRIEVAEDFGKLRTEVAEKLGAINGTLERVEGRIDHSTERLEERISHSMSVAKWTIGILMPIIIGLIGTAFWLTWHAAKLDSRVERLEHSTRAEQPQARR